MKLSELVLLKTQLDEMTTVPFHNSSIHHLDKINFLIKSRSEYEGKLFDELQKNVSKSFDTYEQSLTVLKDDIKEKIAIAEKFWFQESYTLYEQEANKTVEYLFDIRERTDVDISLFQARLNKQADWHYPGLVIRPGRGLFINEMVAYDPLYIVDVNYTFLMPTLNLFNTQYQNRLRAYPIKENLNDEILIKIPDNQFGMCLAYDYFNYRPFEVLKKYLDEVYQKLKPGGIFAMTFNDCDRASAVELVEKHYCCYTPGYLVRDLALSVGYEIEFSWHDKGPSTWLELKKPGKLTSLKGGQTLAKIVSK